MNNTNRIGKKTSGETPKNSLKDLFVTILETCVKRKIFILITCVIDLLFSYITCKKV